MYRFILVGLNAKLFPYYYLFILFLGILFFIPDIFVNRFATAPALWMQAGIGFGILGYVMLTKDRIILPPKGFILLIVVWAIYHIWQSLKNIESIVNIMTLTVAFLLFYAIWSLLKD